MVTVSPLSIASAIRLPLPIYTAVPVGRMTTDSGEVFSVLAGVPREVASELRARSLDKTDEELQSNTRDMERFGPDGSYESWYTKGRLPMVLLSPAGNLAAIAWYGPSELPMDSERPVENPDGEWDTAGYRAYGEYRGKGLMTPFISFTLQMHDTIMPGRRIWIETNEDNAAGRRVFQKAGYVEHGRRASNGRIMMVNA